MVSKYKRHPISSDGVTLYREAFALGLKHYLHSPYKKSILRVNKYFKDRIEAFDDYYPYVKINSNVIHIYNLISFYILIYDDLECNKLRLKLGDENIILT